jgi:predicted amidohydrolase
MHRKPILKITASDCGVYHVAVNAGANEADYDRADRLSVALRPAVALINQTIRRLYDDGAATAQVEASV